MSTDNTKMSENAITPSVLNKMFGRALMYGASWNYERMQNLGFLYMMVPALKKTYKNNTPAMAQAVAQSDARRILIPANRCDTLVVGVSAPIGTLVEQAAAAVLDGCRN